MDLDDTLINRSSAVADWAADFSEVRQLSGEAAQILADALRERATLETFAALRAELGLPESAADLWGAYVAGIASRVECPPETLARLDMLRAAGWSVGVLTNGATDIQRAKLVATGILDRVDAVCISEEAGARKPDPRAFRTAAARCGHELSRDVWMVGDNLETDIAGASAAGLRSIWITPGFAPVVSNVAPDHVAETLIEAADFLLALPEGSR
ncbi:HAD family hydrolase [Kitasatospora sp. NPDC093558]|uniref:HAD family hydrolase n=1 Tax=Kitasatospora sp. NPDC093558 TaxID=3155201 RepID=UPI00343E8FE0